jgi:hypothetical protein
MAKKLRRSAKEWRDWKCTCGHERWLHAGEDKGLEKCFPAITKGFCAKKEYTASMLGMSYTYCCDCSKFKLDNFWYVKQYAKRKHKS